MDAMIQQTIDGMLSGFAHVQVSDPGVQAEIDAFREEMYALGERAGDVGAFMTELQSSGLMQKQTDLMTRASQAASAPAAAADAPPAGETAPKLPTVSEFLEQYRASYEAAQSHGYQDRAVAAYEKLFAVADRTDDLLEMHIILEEEGLLRGLTAEALYDINRLHYDASDPNHAGVREQFQSLMQLAEEYRTDEELEYRTEVLVQENQQRTYRFNARMHAPLNLAHALLGYVRCKQIVWTGQELEKYVPAFIIARENVRRTYGTVQQLFDLDYDTMLADPWLQSKLLVQVAVEPLSLGSRCLNPANLELYREILFTEALSDLSDAELLLRPFENAVHFDIDPAHVPEHKGVEDRLRAAAEEPLKDRYYFGYQEKVGRS